MRGPEDLLLYTVVVQNQGNFPVNDVAITDNLPLDVVDFVTVESSDFICEITGGVIQCGGGSLGVGQIATVEIVVEPEVSGTIANRAIVFAGRTRVAEDTETTLVREPAVADEDEDPDDGEGANDGGDDNNGGNNNGNNNDDGNNDDDTNEDDSVVVISGDDNEVDNDDEAPDDVIVETIPDKDTLPNTGGGAATAGLLLGAGALVLFGALLVRRFVASRGL